MIYNSFDTIPFKLFLKVTQTGDLTLLSDEKKLYNELSEAWKQINSEFNEIDPNKTIEKTLKTLIDIEEYTAQYNFLEIAVKALRFDRNLDIENKVRELGFKLCEESFQYDLTVVENESKMLLVFIEEAEDKLPKVDGKRATNIDQVILGYCAFTGLQFTDTNKITGNQYYGLKEIFDEKLKVLKQQKAKNTKRG
ncbi:hypothetical protein [uncultured Wocania sp.]|uniref:hypothetical protein n=1 Tax=uncultured Wocania sp. TaxID=2834404 RepID=UPI0030F588A8